MTRFTVTYSGNALKELTELWLDAQDQRQITVSADAIERELKFDADLKGEYVLDQLRKLEIAPLVFYYLASPLDRLATVWSVRIAKRQSGGP